MESGEYVNFAQSVNAGCVPDEANIHILLYLAKTNYRANGADHAGLGIRDGVSESRDHTDFVARLRNPGKLIITSYIPMNILIQTPTCMIKYRLGHAISVITDR